jgi:Ca2+-binding EF-hand superfamily protein
MNINKLNYSYAIPVSPPRPMAQNITDNLFSTLDPTNKGYFEKSDLKSLFDATTAEDSNQITNNLFSNFDSNSDGKVTKDEMTSVLEQFTGTIDNYAQANIQKQADMLPCHHHHFKPFDYGQGNASESPMVNETGTLAADSDYAINVSDIDTNNDGKISVSDAIYINRKQNGLASFSYPSRIFTPTQYTSLTTGTTDLRSTIPGVSSITINTPVSGTTTGNYYLISPGYKGQVTY